jgi:putative cardiolipin synthase
MKLRWKWVFLTPFLLIALVYGILVAGYFLERQLYTVKKPSAPLLYESSSPNQVVLLTDGMMSFAARLSLIREANRSIELEFFIFDVDHSSRIIIKELLAKASQGVKVRLLVDFAQPVFRLHPQIAKVLQDGGIAVRYYNTRPIHRILSQQHRNHRKLLIVDEMAAITGGRNIADDYFGISERYNFHDTDVLIRGDVAAAMSRSFGIYWDSHLSEEPQSEQFEDAFRLQAQDLRILDYVDTEIVPRLATLKNHSCEDNLFVSDFPGVGESERLVFKTIAQESAAARSSIYAESPYLIFKSGGLELLDQLTSRGIKMRFLTNGLYSTDAYYTVSALYMTLTKLATYPLELRAFQGQAPPSFQNQRFASPMPFVPSQRWGLHSKRAIIDKKTSVVGTYNIDPRSANLNSEMIYICRNNPGLAAELESDMNARWDDSRDLIAPDDQAVLYDNLLKGADTSAVRKFWLVMPFSSLFDFLL